MSKLGGARPGAGRKPGSKYLDLQELLKAKGKEDGKDYIQEYIDFLLANYMEDTKLMIWVGEHLFGKPVQPIEGDLSGTLTLTFDPTFNAPPRTSEKDSQK